MSRFSTRRALVAKREGRFGQQQIGPRGDHLAAGAHQADAGDGFDWGTVHVDLALRHLHIVDLRPLAGVESARRKRPQDSEALDLRSIFVLEVGDVFRQTQTYPANTNMHVNSLVLTRPATPADYRQDKGL